MTDLGIKRKDLESGFYGCAPCCESDPQKKTDWENTVIHPEVRLEGGHAEKFGIDDLQLGDRIRFEVAAEVSALRSDERLVDGKKKRDLCLTLKLVEASDMVPEGSGAAKDDDDEKVGDAETAGRMALDSILGSK